MSDLEVRNSLADEVPGLLRYARTIAPDSHQAEDLVQDTLVRALQRAESFHGEASLASWLHRILHNLAVDRFRRDREDATEDVGREVEDRWREESYTVDAAIVVERAETRQELQDALVRLPVIHRTVVVLHDAEEMTVAEIADVQDVGLPATKQRLRRTLTTGSRPPTGCSWSATSKPVPRAHRCTPPWWGRALPWASCAMPTPVVPPELADRIKGLLAHK